MQTDECPTCRATNTDREHCMCFMGTLGDRRRNDPEALKRLVRVGFSDGTFALVTAEQQPHVLRQTVRDIVSIAAPSARLPWDWASGTYERTYPNDCYTGGLLAYGPLVRSERCGPNLGGVLYPYHRSL